MGLKTLPSSLRSKERYILFRIEAADEFSLNDVVEQVWKEMVSFLGEQQVAAVNPWVLGDLFSRKEQVGGIRVNKDYVEEVRTSLALMDHINGTPVCVHVLGVSGTMQSARDKYLGSLQD